MDTIIAVAVVILGLLCWVGQTLAVFAPRVAETLRLIEKREDLDEAMYLFEIYAQGIPDFLLTWMLPASALMMLLDAPHWPILALVGAGIYLYFPIVFSVTRVVLKANGRNVGTPSNQAAAFTLGALWIFSAVAMIYLAVARLAEMG